MAALDPQEVFLLERYTSAAYTGQLRDVWGEMIAHVEQCVDAFMRKPPRDDRSRLLPDRPDIVWGERVLPNFRDTCRALCDGYIELTHGDLAGLDACHGPMSDAKGQSDFSPDWMNVADRETYGRLLNRASGMAGNISASVGAYWSPGELTSRYDESARGALDPPPRWPVYALDTHTAVRTGHPVKVSGIYLPDTDNSGAQFLSAAGDVAPEACAFIRMEDLLNPDNGQKYAGQPIFDKRAVLWRLVTRTSDAGTTWPIEGAVAPQRRHLSTSATGQASAPTR
ncbi:MAG: hypothetical protein ABIT83_18875 [Massilia sp.]